MEPEYKHIINLKRMNNSERYAELLGVIYRQLPPVDEITEEWIVEWLSGFDSPHTRKNYGVLLKMALRHYGREHIMDDIDLPTTIHISVSRNDLITQDEYFALLRAAEKPMMKAYIQLLWWSGARTIELERLKKRDVTIEGNLMLFTLTGKGKTRTIPIPIDRLDHFAYWVSVCEGPEVFDIYRDTLYKYMHRIYEKAGVQKRDRICYIFRHTRATLYAQQMPEALLRQYFGWSPTSDMPRRYVHLSNKDLIGFFTKDETEDSQDQWVPKPVKHRD